MKVTADLPNLASEIRALVTEADDLPPIDQWQPTRVGEIDILIDKHGDWFYRGDKMEREAIARLFSRILRKEEGQYFLVTPVEKLKIQVEDAPFIVRLIDIEGEGVERKIHFATNMGDHFTLDSNHPLTLVSDGTSQDPKPYVHVRAELKARLSSAVYYELAKYVDESETSDNDFGVWSAGEFNLFGTE